MTQAAKVTMALALMLGAQARAELIVDTGVPTGLLAALYNDSANGNGFQSLGARFTLGADYQVNAISLYVGGGDCGGPGGDACFGPFAPPAFQDAMLVRLWSGAPSLSATPILSQSFVQPFVGFDPGWERYSFNGLNLRAGTYAVTFEPQAGYDSTAPLGAPLPQPVRYVLNDSLNDWFPSTNLARGIGLQVEGVLAAVPEPGSAAMLALGSLVLLGHRRWRSARR